MPNTKQSETIVFDDPMGRHDLVLKFVPSPDSESIMVFSARYPAGTTKTDGWESLQTVFRMLCVLPDREAKGELLSIMGGDEVSPPGVVLS